MARLYTHGLADGDGFTTNDGIYVPTYLFSATGDIDQIRIHSVVATVRKNKDQYNIDTIFFKPQSGKFEITLTDGRQYSHGADVAFFNAISNVIKNNKVHIDEVQLNPIHAVAIHTRVIEAEVVKIITSPEQRS